MLNILGGKSPNDHLELARLALDIDGTVHLYGKGPGTAGRKMGHITVTASTMREAESRMAPLIRKFDAISGRVHNTTLWQDSSLPAAIVAVVMGSDSDLVTMAPGIRILEKFAIPYTVRITSAHRTPNYMAEYAARAASDGIKVIIAGAGGAAHLPGMAAAHTSLPVIGVPVKATHLDGVDSLHSIVQMPRGVPVATVGISNSTNAALLAARILGIEDPRIRKEVEDYAKAALEENLAKDLRIFEMGWEKYMEQMPKKT
jgi:phosphoribosylaminoimidazole carboxylase